MKGTEIFYYYTELETNELLESYALECGPSHCCKLEKYKKEISLKESLKKPLRCLLGLPLKWKTEQNPAEERFLDSLLDIGAGDGNVTAKLAPLFKKVVVTELSTPMVRRLEGQGYTTFHTADLTPAGSETTPLNLLLCSRCSILWGVLIVVFLCVQGFLGKAISVWWHC